MEAQAQRSRSWANFVENSYLTGRLITDSIALLARGLGDVGTEAGSTESAVLWGATAGLG